MNDDRLVRLIAQVAHARDGQTLEHSTRMIDIGRVLAEAMALPAPTVEAIKLGALLHDIGKNAIPDTVLFKHGRLDPEERRIMALHPQQGHDMLRLAQHPMLDVAADIALSHHENYNGSGYPRGLAGEKIALPARVVAVADVYDALRAIRSYKPGLSHEQAMRIITKGDDRTTPDCFDPAVLAALEKRQGAIQALYG